MSEVKHTPEPWLVHSYSHPRMMHSCIEDGHGKVIAEIPNKHTSLHDAARIVECVNAFAGIPDPAAFMAVVKQLELDHADKLKEQREELMKHLKAVTDVCIVLGCLGGRYPDHKEKLTNALNYLKQLQNEKTNQ